MTDKQIIEARKMLGAALNARRAARRCRQGTHITVRDVPYDKLQRYAEAHDRAATSALAEARQLLLEAA